MKNNIKILTSLAIAFVFANCQRDRTNPAQGLEGRELVVYSIQSMQNYVNINQNYGRSVLSMSFKASNRGLHFKPDTTVNQKWFRELGDTQMVGFSSGFAGRNMMEINFPLPNQDLMIEKFPLMTVIPTSVLSGVYNVDYGFLPGTGQRGWIITKYDRIGPRGQAGQPLVTIQLLDR